MMSSLLLSILACLMAAASSILIFGSPDSIALVIPPKSSTSLIKSQAFSAISSVSFSTYSEPPQGSIIFVISVSFCINNCVFLAILAAYSLGKAIASSSELVCNDCVPPSTADIASTHVLVTLLYGSCSVKLHPDV